MTDNHNYEEPEPGMNDWHVPINQNFEKIDRDIEIRDIEANIEDYEPKEGAKYEAIDSGAVYHSTGDDWILIDREVDQLNARKINNNAYISQYQGDDLGEKIENAISATNKTQETVHITPKDSGGPWSWNKDIEITNQSLEIIVSDGAKIEYTGDGWPITFDGSTDSRKRLKISGGVWKSTGEPDGWLKLKDGTHCFVSPHKVEFKNSSGGGRAINLENHNGYCELNVIEGVYTCDIGIDYIPASITNGSGTESFQGNTIRDVAINVTGDRDKGDNFAIRPRGDFRYANIRRPNMFGKAEGAVGILLDSPRMDGCVITAPQFESVSGSGHAGFKGGPNYDEFYGPTIIGGSMDLNSGASGIPWDSGKSGDGSPVKFTASGKGAAMVKTRNGNGGGPYELKMSHFGDVSVPGNVNVSGDLQKNGSDVIYLRGSTQSVKLPKQDLASINATSNEDGEIFHHNGASVIQADGVASDKAGYYVWSENDGEWKSMVEY